MSYAVSYEGRTRDPIAMLGIAATLIMHGETMRSVMPRAVLSLIDGDLPQARTYAREAARQTRSALGAIDEAEVFEEARTVRDARLLLRVCLSTRQAEREIGRLGHALRSAEDRDTAADPVVLLRNATRAHAIGSRAMAAAVVAVAEELGPTAAIRLPTAAAQIAEGDTEAADLVAHGSAVEFAAAFEDEPTDTQPVAVQKLSSRNRGVSI